MIVYRLSKAKYAESLDGRGAELAGGRWNSKGIPVIYTAEHISLCMAEVAVHLPLGIVPTDYNLIAPDIPEEEINADFKKDLPYDWRTTYTIEDTQNIGDHFFTSGLKMILKVPSVVVQGEFNYLINPRHPKIKKVKIIKNQPFNFDERLFLR